MLQKKLFGAEWITKSKKKSTHWKLDDVEETQN